MFVQEVIKRFKKTRPVCLMARIALARVLSPGAINEIFHEHAEEQYERKISFSMLTELMASVTLCFSRSVNAAAKKQRDKLQASLSCVYDKLGRVEPQVMQALVRHSYEQSREACNHMRMWDTSYITGYRTKILDGNHLSGTEHRLKEMRRERAAALPGKSLVVLDPQCRAIQDIFPIEDGHAQERSALDDVIETIEKGDLWVADRNFCTHKFMYSIDERKAAFVIRQHGNLLGKVSGSRRYLGKTATGKVYERTLALSGYQGRTLKLRRIEVDLNEPTRDKETTINLLTNVPIADATAVKIATVYAARWKIETAFQTLTTTLRCEVNTLCYPRAALFAFSAAIVSYNAIIVTEYAIRAEHGKAYAEQLSKYYMAMEISENHNGMMALLEDSDFDIYHDMSVDEFCDEIRDVARNVDLEGYRKSTRGPKKPVRKKPANSRIVHVSVAKVLSHRK